MMSQSGTFTPLIGNSDKKWRYWTNKVLHHNDKVH